MKKTVIDLPDVLERVQDDWELLLELLDIFDQDFQVKRPALSEFFAQKNFDKIRDIAHSLKGAAGNISAKELFQSFYQLEKMAEGKDPSRMEAVFKAIDQQFTDLRAAVVELKKDHPKK